MTVSLAGTVSVLNGFEYQLPTMAGNSLEELCAPLLRQEEGVEWPHAIGGVHLPRLSASARAPSVPEPSWVRRAHHRRNLAKLSQLAILTACGRHAAVHYGDCSRPQQESSIRCSTSHSCQRICWAYLDPSRTRAPGSTLLGRGAGG